LKQSTSQRESLTRAAKFYHSALHEAEDYLAERGITLEQATKARLGVVLEPLTGHDFRATSFISICEGEIDTITLDHVCGIPAVGVPGVNNWKKHYSRLLADFDKVFLFADGDNAGTEFGKSLSRELGNLVVVQMPEGEDVNSMYRTHGAEYFKHKIESAQ